MVLVGNDVFLQKMGHYLKNNGGASVYVTMKASNDASKPSTLMRLKFRKERYSTQVDSRDIMRFQLSLASLYKGVLPKRVSKRKLQAKRQQASADKKREKL